MSYRCLWRAWLNNCLRHNVIIVLMVIFQPHTEITNAIKIMYIVQQILPKTNHNKSMQAMKDFMFSVIASEYLFGHFRNRFDLVGMTYRFGNCCVWYFSSLFPLSIIWILRQFCYCNSPVPFYSNYSAELSPNWRRRK